MARDIVCHFFKEFIPANTIGSQEKVQSIRHDMSSSHWKAFNRILIYSLKVNYFPLAISQTFTIASIFGEEFITKSRLLDSFKNYVSIDERDTLINALESFEKSDELLELLSAYHCYKKPKKENIDEIFVESAHQEIVQKPRYVSNCITEEFSKNRPKEFSSIDSLDMLYQQLKPTAKKIIKNIQSEADTDQARIVEDHLNTIVDIICGKNLK